MSDEFFKEGGPLKIKHIDSDHISMKVLIDLGPDGRLARECPNEDCRPGYFKVKPGTGIVENQLYAYCPYCHLKKEPSAFFSREQIRYAKDIAFSEVKESFERTIENTLRGGPLRYTKGPKIIVAPPVEEILQRDIICPYCGLDHSVYGIGFWCADCGRDIFLSHVKSEINTLRTMLADLIKRKEILGNRVWSKDLENCLEDVVSFFEGVLRAEVRIRLMRRHSSFQEIDDIFSKIGNTFQNIERAKEYFLKNYDVHLLSALNEKEAEHLIQIFAKRHIITHNLSVIDKKYILQARATEMEGRNISVSVDEIEEALGLLFRIFESVHDTPSEEAGPGDPGPEK